MNSKAKRKAFKKKMKQKYKESINNAIAMVFVVSPKLNEGMIEIELPKRFNQLGINPSIKKDQNEQGVYFVIQPSNKNNYVSLKFGNVDVELMAEISDFEIIMDEPIESILGEKVVAISTYINKSEVNDLLFTACIRALGPLSEGILINVGSGVIIDDWISWSLDYMGTSIHETKRVYDDNCPDFGEVLKINEDLIYKNLGGKHGNSNISVNAETNSELFQRLSFKQNDSYMLSTETMRVEEENNKYYHWRFAKNGKPHPEICSVCGRKTNWDFIRHDFRLKIKKFDFSITYDGYVITSKKAFDFLQSYNVEFVKLNLEKSFYVLKTWTLPIIHIDLKPSGIRFELKCEKCQEYAGVYLGRIPGRPPQIQPLKFNMTDKTYDLSRTDFEFGSSHEQHPIIIISDAFAKELMRSKLKGVYIHSI